MNKKPTLKQFLQDRGKISQYKNKTASQKDGESQATKGGYPRGTRPGDGGLAEGMTCTRMEEEEAEAPMDGEQSDMEMQDINDEQMMNDDPTDMEEQDPNNMVKRTVKGAHLVYKRATEEGSYEELWIYQTDNIKNDQTVMKAILAGTDIPSGKMKSEDGIQSYEMWSAGNAQMIKIEGLPN